jgi:general secretion pathway protein C
MRFWHAREGIRRNMNVRSSRVLAPGQLYRALEIALIILIALQAARFVWVLVTPLAPLGEPRKQVAQGNVPSGFDPFFRLSSPPGSAAVTSLALKLFGVRVDEAMGGGSAIIETPDGIQSSFAVGDEILPGVKLKQVAFDSIMIDRNGGNEQLFLDQSISAPIAQPSANASSTTVASAPSTSVMPPPPPKVDGNVVQQEQRPLKQ